MKQVVQNARSGELALRTVPDPRVKPGHLLVRTRASLISAGTERLAVRFSRKNLIEKARARPDLVRKTIGKVRRDGLAEAARAVMTRLDEPLPLGYSAAGVVVEVGAGLEGRYRPGQRVAVAGAGLANHAEMNTVPDNLAAPVPDGVAHEEACYATLCAIALHGVRLSRPELGAWCAVIGVGLVGQLAAQFLTLSGARVLALDFDPDRLALAERLGAEAIYDLKGRDPQAAAMAATDGVGCDAVVIAAATESSAPFETAAQVARDRAIVSLVGYTGTTFPYREFMHKELTVTVSRSYGPGRYDPDYEARGMKYPPGFVRWTETENLKTALDLMRPGRSPRLDPGALTTHRFDFDRAEDAYALVVDGAEPHLGGDPPVRRARTRTSGASRPSCAGGGWPGVHDTGTLRARGHRRRDLRAHDAAAGAEGDGGLRAAYHRHLARHLRRTRPATLRLRPRGHRRRGGLRQSRHQRGPAGDAAQPARRPDRARPERRQARLRRKAPVPDAGRTPGDSSPRPTLPRLSSRSGSTGVSRR